MDMVYSLIATLGVNSTLFIMMGIFVGTYWVCYVLFLRRLSKFLVERDSRTQGRSESVDHLNEELQALDMQIQARRKEVQVEADKLFTEIKTKALAEQAVVVKTARDKAQAELKGVREEVQTEFAREMQKIKIEVPLLAKEILARLMTAGKKSQRNGDSSVRKEL
ncbi:MAG: ATP synthase F0 subunit B [Bdellovibrionota bacterium]